MTKKEARQQVKEWMKKLDKNYIEKADQSIFEQVKELKEFQEAKTIFCYASMKNEVDTWQLIASALKQGKNVGVPLCIGKGIMEVRQIHALDDFEEGAYGIMEPSRRCPILSKEKIDMAVIPCVSADRDGWDIAIGQDDVYAVEFNLGFGIEHAQTIAGGFRRKLGILR